MKKERRGGIPVGRGFAGNIAKAAQRKIDVGKSEGFENNRGKENYP